ncbi:TIGR03560 family F420-dependent LLM class oxidoreductase [Actinopolymorpha pittospori]|uniref:F420-dependent oxidoreductase-like protein n=1 Tax=Actinopolymorpha pittospori TaxID=648752 RepID=A0A927RAN4_9ACTN|nr:F420-dependent oxidoreductase-like protein [Actinopolymorpha pittospori]
MSVTRFGLQIPNFTYPDVPDAQLFERVAAIAGTAEQAGFDSIWVMDHFYQLPGIGPEDAPMFEAYSLLSALAARTSKAKLGTMVTGVTYRNPALLAKTVTVLDVISSGRGILGIGAAWNESEHRGYGFEFPPTRERMDRLEEALQICRAMFTEHSPSFSGKYYQINNAYNVPRPVTPGGPPIMIGGGGEKRTLRMVAKYGDASNIFGDIATIQHKLAVLGQHCADVGRDPAEITKTKLATLLIGPDEKAAQAKIDHMRSLGVDDAWLRQTAIVGSPEQVLEQVKEHFDAGLDGLLFNMPDGHDLETVALAGETLAKYV